jgi:hypothetical protein
MKKQTLFGFLMVGLLVSIFSISRQHNRIITNLVDLESVDTIIPIHGCWVSEDYYISLKEHKSPKKAQNNSLLFVIPESISEKTTIMYDFHDAFDSYAIVKNLNDYEIWENFNNHNTRLEYTIKVISSTKLKIGETILIKIDPIKVKDFFHNGLKNELLVQEELLFKGIYITPDGKKVEFKNNGQIEGLEGYFYYKPESDYYDQGMQVDQLILVKSEKNIEWKDLEYYGFKFNYDTLELYKLNCLEFDSTSKYCGVVELGKLEYKLWKTNNNR